MFVSADEDGNLLEEPDPLNSKYCIGELERDCNEHAKDYNYWIDCSTNVLFDGFKVIGSDDDGIELELTDQDFWIIVLSTSISIQHYNGESWEIKTVIEMLDFLK